MFKSATVDSSSAKASTNSSPFHRESEQEAFIQPKLNIGKPNDKYEVEADMVADKVVNKTSANAKSSFFSPVAAIQKKDIQRKEATEEIQEKPIAKTITPLVQLASAEEETVQEKCSKCENEETVQKQESEDETVQTKTENQTNPLANLGNRIQQSRGTGRPMPTLTKNRMEKGFGVDFSAVRIHTDSQSVGMNSDLGARAFTNNNDIFFNAGEYNPQSKDGQTLLAHELTHTVQQGASVSMKPDIQKRASVLEMAELLKQIELSNQEQKEAFDPTRANETRADAAKEGTDAEALANDQIPEIEPSETEVPVVEDKTDTSRIAIPIPMEPDNVVPSSQGKQEKAPAQESAPQESSPVTDATSGSPEGIATNNSESTKGASGASKEGGETLKYLEQESADVCNKGAEKTQKLADNQTAHDTAGEKTGQTTLAVVPPEQEGQSRGNADQVKSLEGATAPEPKDAVIKKDMDKAITEAVPKKIVELNEFESGKRAQVIGNKVLAETAKQVGEVKGTYNEIENKAEPNEIDVPEGLPKMEQAPSTPTLNLGKGAVPSVPQEQTDLSSFEEKADDIYEKEGISQDMQAEFENVDSGDIAEANKEKVVLKEKVVNEPSKLQEFSNQEQGKVETDLQSEETLIKTSMEEKRKSELEGVKSKQVKTKTDIEKKREVVTNWINDKYVKAKDFVTDKLSKLETEALDKFDKGQKLHSVKFEQNVKRRVNAWKDDRYSGFWGGAKWLKDKVVGIDHFSEIKEIFTTERETFVNAIDLLILDINTENEKTIKLCKDEITKAKIEIQEFIDKLGPDLIDVGKKTQEETAKKLAVLDKHIEKEKKKLQQKLCDKKDEAIKAIDKKIEEMKAEMSGLVGKLGALLLYAAKKFFKWAISKIGGSADKIIAILDKGATVLKKLFTDPIGFFKNLVKAVGGGIKGFVKNIVVWLKKGLVAWLMGQMGDSGLELPPKFDAKGIIFMGLQVAGLTWNVIRARIVKQLGPKGEAIMSTAEKTVDIIKRVVKEGPIALWHIILEKVDEIKTKVMAGIRNWAITQIIKKLSFKLLSMLNPAGAIVQAIMLLYDVVMFFIENWNRIVDFVKSVFDSIGSIASGAIGAASQFIENTLGKTLPIILSFAARFVGLAGIGKAIRKVIETIQKPFKNILNKMIKFLVKQVKKLSKSGKVKVKGVVNAIFQWWKKKKNFKAKDGKSHKLYYKGKGKNAKMMVASKPTAIELMLNHKLKNAEGGKRQNIETALSLHKETEKLQKEIEKIAEAKQKEKADELDIKMVSLSQLMKDVMIEGDDEVKKFIEKYLGKNVYIKSGERLNKTFEKDAKKVGYEFFSVDDPNLVKQIKRAGGKAESNPALTIESSSKLLKEGSGTSSKPEHDNFIPQKIVIESTTKGKYKASYKTKTADGKSGPEFTVEISYDQAEAGIPNKIQVRKVQGKNLSNKSSGIGRGKTDSASVFHNAHIIGDQFGGSGKNSSLNIHPSSPAYNTKDMLNVENQMAAHFKKSKQKYDLTATARVTDDNNSPGNLKKLLSDEFNKDNSENIKFVKDAEDKKAKDELISSLQSSINKDMTGVPAKFLSINYESSGLGDDFTSGLKTKIKGDDRSQKAETKIQSDKSIRIGEDADFESTKDKFLASKK